MHSESFYASRIMHVKPFRMHEQNESGAMYKCASETPVERHTDELQRSCNLDRALSTAVHTHNADHGAEHGASTS
jgi:hypothetical protein